MLVGQDVDLIRFDAGKLEAKFEKTFKFGPPIGIFPVSVGATVGFGVKGHLEVGYDTRGIRNAVKNIIDGNTERLRHGRVAVPGRVLRRLEGR